MSEAWARHPVFVDYEVSTEGRVRRLTPKKGTSVGRMKSPTLSTTGYLTVVIEKRPRKVHVLVLETFIGARPTGHDGCHKNGIRVDNRLSNLKWATRTENMRDARAHGTLAEGDKHGRAKLTRLEVEKIRSLASGGMLQKHIAPFFNVTRGHISEIVAGKIWK